MKSAVKLALAAFNHAIERHGGKVIEIVLDEHAYDLLETEAMPWIDKTCPSDMITLKTDEGHKINVRRPSKDKAPAYYYPFVGTPKKDG